MLLVDQVSFTQAFHAGIDFIAQTLTTHAYSMPYQAMLPSSVEQAATRTGEPSALFYTFTESEASILWSMPRPQLELVTSHLADFPISTDTTAVPTMPATFEIPAIEIPAKLTAPAAHGSLRCADDGLSYGSHNDVNNTILNQVFQGSLNDSDSGGVYEATPTHPAPQPEQNPVISMLDSKFSLENMQPGLLLQEPSLILVIAVILEMLLPIPQRFKFSGLQAIFHRLSRKVNLPQVSNSQRSFAGFFLPLILVVCFEAVVVFLDFFTESDSLITLLVMVYLLELRFPQETALQISSDLHAGQKEQAREHLYPYVLREVKKLSNVGIAKAACESTILRSVHGWFAVMIWYFIGGIEGAVIMQCFVVMSRAFNYKLPDNYMFGRCVFMMIELMLAIPALALGFMLMFYKNPLKPWATGMQGMQDYPAPITGFILGAVGGALDISLGGPRYYFGRLIRLPRIGGTQEPDAETVVKSMRKIRLSGIILLFFAILIDLNFF